MTDLSFIRDLRIKNNADFADIFIENHMSFAVVLEDNKIDRISSGFDCGKAIRVIKGKEIDFEFETKKQNNSIDNNHDADKIIELLFSADKIARSRSPKIKQVTVSYANKIQNIEVLNSNGLHIKDKRIHSRFIINVVVEDKDILETGYEAAGSQGVDIENDFFNPSNIEFLSKNAAERALLMLSSRHAPSGKMPVVILSEAGGTLIHEACGHGLEADFIVKKTSVYEGKIGQKVASDLITVIDDATIPGNYGSYRFDDEGTPAQKKILIENGILKIYMSDLYYSNILKLSSSGNGRRENYHTKPQPRMTNTYIERGKTDPQEIINSVKNGLLVKKLGGGQVNVTNGDFVFDVQESYLIENGKIKEPVRGAMLIGNGPKILNDIDMVGNDLNFITGTCGKGDHAPVTDAMPTIRIPEIVVGGRN